MKKIRKRGRKKKDTILKVYLQENGKDAKWVFEKVQMKFGNYIKDVKEIEALIDGSKWMDINDKILIGFALGINWKIFNG